MPQPTRHKILIIGAGLGGLAAAACLLQDGHDVDVFDQTRELGEVGAGIQISANAMHVLRHMQVADELAEQAVRPLAYTFCMGDTGEVIQSFPLSLEHEDKHGAPYFHVHRADLHDILVRRVLALKPGCIHLDHRLVEYAETNDGVTAVFASGNQVSGDILIGADGLKSNVRRQMRGADNPVYTGDSVWRAMVPAEKVLREFNVVEQKLWMMPGGHAIAYFIRNCSIVNFGLVKKKVKTAEESWTIRRPWEELKADVEGWNPAVQAIVDAADKDACYLWALHIREPKSDWSTNRVTTLGDSVHATLPYLAQGAAMAFEDAAVIARALQQEANITEALQLYQRNRYERTGRVVRESSENGSIFHQPSREALRDVFANRNMGAERSNWLFSYNPLTVALV